MSGRIRLGCIADDFTGATDLACLAPAPIEPLSAQRIQDLREAFGAVW